MPDFTDWRAQDPDGSIIVEEGRVSWRKADRTAVRYIGKQIEISGDFQHSFVVCFLEGEVEDELNQGFIRLWEIRKGKMVTDGLSTLNSYVTAIRYLLSKDRYSSTSTTAML